ncbi:hypothetical protein JXB27_04550 [Candidatus Woesearchaeota archaeon]|nr:hypothetical protein [Candidatus Woesearchaeota archaeon]
MDKKISGFLKEWMIRYLKNKDIITKKIVGVEEFDDSFKIARSDKEIVFFVEPFLIDLNFFDELKKPEHRALVCFHTKKNFNVFLTKWKEFVGVGRNFAVYFVNPFSKLERVLILNPHTHALISDDDSLEQGLKTMAETVEFTTDEEVKKIISS